MTSMKLKKKLKQIAIVVAASFAITGACPDLPLVSPTQVVEVQAATKKPTCVAQQTVYVDAAYGGPNARDRGKNIMTLPDCYIFIKNLASNAKVSNIKSSNAKLKAEKREGTNAVNITAAKPASNENLTGVSSTISFKVTQGSKTYKLSCKVKVAEKKSPFSEFKVGSKDIAHYFDGYRYVKGVKVKGTQKVSVKMASGYVMDSIEITYTKNGKYVSKYIKNGSKVNLDKRMHINVLYHVAKKPVNYTAPTKWYGVVPSPLHEYNTFLIH